ncbi:response regulator transcription factor [Rhodococcus qingshengii]|uniref:response regulator transcription factor n=1 Tax=Rhodococcus qingshengii TaxID=334542 RepID=UPI0037C74575
MPDNSTYRDTDSGTAKITAGELYAARQPESNKTCTQENTEKIGILLLTLKIHLQPPMNKKKINQCRALLDEALTLTAEQSTSLSSRNIGRRLTRREREIALALSQGKSNSAIADDLYVSINTVRFHVRNTLRKLEATNRNEVAALVLRQVE